ncbi:sodium/solute symporter [bacterium]|nr:sodium/solute symporter [bacterium]
MYTSLAASDIWIIIVYFGLLLTVGFYYSRRSRSTADYFLAGKQAGWLATGSSLFAVSISSEHFIGIAGAGAALGIAAGNLELIACFMVLLLGWFFAPLYIKMGLFTVPEFLERRFGRKSRLYLTALSLAAYMFIKIAITIMAGGVLLHETLGWDTATSAVLIVAIAGIYATAGGLNAIIRVDILHAALLIIGATVLTIAGLHNVGGFSALRAAVPEGHFHLFKSMSDPDFPWTGIVLGGPVLGAWYWCMDQYIVQRVLGAKNALQARRGAVFAGFLKLFSVFIFLIPGVIALAIYGNGKLSDSVFPLLVAGNLLPAGIKGVVIAGLLAALISALASAFNSSSALFTMDYYRTIRTGASDDALVLVGRLATTVLVICSIIAVPFLKVRETNSYMYLLNIQASTGPAVAALFLWGIIRKKGTDKAAIAALITGTVIGGLRLALEFLSGKGVALWAPFEAVMSLNFLHFAFLLFLICIGVLYVSSFEGRGPRSERSRDSMTAGKDALPVYKKMIQGDGLIVVLSALLICIVLGVYIYYA